MSTIGIISDTHGDEYGTMAAARIFQSFEIRTVLHCGDIGVPAVVDRLSTFEAHFVTGNVDFHAAELKRAVEEQGQHFHGRFGDLLIDSVRIGLIHGDDEKRLQTTLECGEYGLVVSGHTHKSHLKTVGTTTWLNPGAIYRAKSKSVAVVELPNIDVTIVPV